MASFLSESFPVKKEHTAKNKITLQQVTLVHLISNFALNVYYA